MAITWRELSSCTRVDLDVSPGLRRPPLRPSLPPSPQSQPGEAPTGPARARENHQRCVEVAGETAEGATTKISVAQLAEVDRITSEDAYAEALAAEQLWELEPDGTLTEATDDDAATRGRAWSARNRGVWGRG